MAESMEGRVQSQTLAMNVEVNNDYGLWISINCKPIHGWLLSIN